MFEFKNEVKGIEVVAEFVADGGLGKFFGVRQDNQKRLVCEDCGSVMTFLTAYCGPFYLKGTCDCDKPGWEQPTLHNTKNCCRNCGDWYGGEYCDCEIAPLHEEAKSMNRLHDRQRQPELPAPSPFKVKLGILAHVG